MSAGAAAYAAMGLIIAGCAAYAWAARRRRPVPGLPDDGKGCMSEEEFLELLLIALEAGETIPGPERTP